MKIWNNCRKAGYVILFAAVISMSAYIFYGAVDTLKYADALENVINGRTVPVVVSGTVLLLAIFAVAILTKGASGDGKTVFQRQWWCSEASWFWCRF